MTRNQRILLAGLILAAFILICPSIGHCTPTCQQLAQVTLAGNLGGANGLPASNYILTLTPSQQGYIAGCQVNLATTNTCATSIDGSVVGIQNPLTATINSTSGSGSLGSGVYYTVYEWYDAAGHVTLASPETATTLSATGALVVNPPSTGKPALAVGMDVFISTSSGAETLQGQTTGTSSFVQATSLASGASPASTNTTLCQVTANDAVWPTGTGYNVTMVDQYGNPVPNYPMQWQLMDAGSTINLSNGLPYYHGVVYYPVPILSAPANHGAQSISGPLSFGGYNLSQIGRLGIGTGTPGWGVDAEGSGINGAVNAKTGYLINGAGGTTGYALCSDGTYYDTPCSFLASDFYQTLALNGTAQTQRPVLNFAPYLFTVTDSGSPAETTVGLNAPGTGQYIATETASPGTSANCATFDGAGNIVPYSTTCGGAGFTSGNNGNGYWVKDPTGHIHQWGVVSGSGSISTNHVVTFHTAFTVSASIEVNATSSTIYGNGIGFLTIESGTVSTTQFEVEVGASAPVDGIHWSADGY